MRIKRYDAPTRFLVESESGQEPYLVELEAYGLTGKCTCKQWECRLGPDIKAGFRGPRLMCKHVTSARDFYAKELKLETDEQINQVLREYAKTQAPRTPAGAWPPPEPMD